MKKLLLILLAILILCGCGQNKESFDGKDRPSTRGQLQVIDGQLCGKDKNPIVLRGLSGNGVSLSDRYINQDTFDELSHKFGANVFRMALYTWGVGVVGYCTGGNKEKLKKLMIDSVELAKKSDMYVILDWHILEDKDPNVYIEEAKLFFDEISKACKDYDNVIYEICNEPNHVEWSDIKKYAEVIIPIIRNNDPDSVIIVGTPNWSQDVDVAADDPLEFDNLLYTLHFYSATHKQELRDKASYALNKGLPVFVTEYGITASSGGFPIDIEEADNWMDFLEENRISHVMWNFSKTPEACAVLKADVLKTKDFTDDDLTESGLWYLKMIDRYSAQ